MKVKDKLFRIEQEFHVFFDQLEQVFYPEFLSLLCAKSKNFEWVIKIIKIQNVSRTKNFVFKKFPICYSLINSGFKRRLILKIFKRESA